MDAQINTQPVAAPIRIPRAASPYWTPKVVVRKMTQEAKGLFIPYPLLAIVSTVVLVIAGGLIGLFVQVATLNSTMIIRDNTYATSVKKLEDSLGLLSLEVDDLRLKQARAEGPVITSNKKKVN